MSSIIPTRRTTRSTRTATHKDNENAKARQLRNNANNNIRAKPPSASSSSAAAAGPASLNPAAGPVRGVAHTAASRAKSIVHEDPPAKQSTSAGDVLPAKRKREALGELTSRTAHPNKPKPVNGKGKEKEKPSSSSSTAVAAPRQALQSRTTRHTTTIVTKNHELQQVKEETEVVELVADDTAMAVDQPTTIPSLRRSIGKAASPRKQQSARRSLDDVDAEDDRALKKRRTSSEVPEEYLEAFEDEEQAVLDEEAEIEARLNAEMEAYANEEEAHPQDSAWTDLDDDADDPTMATEYVLEVFEYLKEVEKTTMPNPAYMHTQKELAWKMRGILSDWLIDVHARFRLLPETLFLCVNMIDRFLSSRIISLAKLQLVGITCLFIAAKIEEVMVPALDYFVKSAEATYSEDDMRRAERYILQILNWNMSYPSPIHFLRRISKADDYNVPVRTMAKYLLEISLLEWRLIAAPPSLLAAAAMWLARLVQGYEVWTPNLAHYSSYSESEVVPTANLMINYILKPVEHKSFFKKYGGKRYNKSSAYMYQWTRERWHEGTKVNLAADLPRLKAHIRIERADEEAREEERERTCRLEDPDTQAGLLQARR